MARFRPLPSFSRMHRHDSLPGHGAIRLQITPNRSWRTAKIQSLGFPTTVPANGELRYHLDPRRSVTDPSFFSSVTADVRVDADDDTGTATSAHVVVTITKG